MDHHQLWRASKMLPPDSKQKEEPFNPLRGASHVLPDNCSETAPLVLPKSNPGTQSFDAEFNAGPKTTPEIQPILLTGNLMLSINCGETVSTHGPPASTKGKVLHVRRPGHNRVLRGDVTLQNSLETLKLASNLFPDLFASIEMLLSCTSVLEALNLSGEIRRNPLTIKPTPRSQGEKEFRSWPKPDYSIFRNEQDPPNDRQREDYEYLTSELPVLSELLSESLGFHWSRPPLSGAATNLIISIDCEVRALKAAVNSSIPMREITPIIYIEIMLHYRIIGTLFLKLQRNLHAYKRNNACYGLLQLTLDRLGLSTVSYHSIEGTNSRYQRTCTPGTRTSVLASLDEWRNKSQPHWIFWVNGLSGTGKTTIAYTFCEEMQKRKLLAASFFCARTPEYRDVGRIITTIACQLAQYSTPFCSALLESLKRNPGVEWDDLRDLFKRLLKEPLEEAKNTFPYNSVVVIDALDKYNDRHGVEHLRDLLVRYAPEMKLKFLITSRPICLTDSNTRKFTPWWPNTLLLHLDDIDKPLVRADIRHHLTQELQHLCSSEIDANRLIEYFGVSFLYAAKLVSYVQSPDKWSSHQERLMSLIDTTPGQLDWRPFIDSAYSDVLNNVAGNLEPGTDGVAVIRAVLQAVLLAHEPINVETICFLGGLPNSIPVGEILHGLQSVLDYSSQTGVVSASHPAFSEFIFSEKRAGPYFCNSAKQSQVLSQICLNEMIKSLHFNICDLESSFLLDEAVEDIDSRIQNRISPTLAYVCRYWADHLTLADNSNTTLTILGEFLSCQLLFWIEVLNLRRELDIGISALLKTKELLEGTSSRPDLTSFLNDAYIFIRDFAASPVSRSTPHIYVSSLQLCPSSSALYQVYARRICGWLKPPENATKYHDVPHLAFQSWKIGSRILSAAYSPDGSRVALGCEDGTANICDAHTGLLLVGPLDGHNDWVRCVVFSPDGACILSASSDCTIQKWDSVSGAPLAASFQGHTHPIKSIAFSPDGTRVVSGSWDNTVRLWNAQDGKPVSEPLEGHKWGVNCVAFSPNNASIASGANDHTIRLWEPGNNIHHAQLLEGHTNGVTSIVFTPDGSQLVSGSVDCSICVWDIKDGTLTTRFLQSCIHLVYSVAISPDGRLVASGSSDSTIKVWDIDTGSAVFGPMGHASGVRTVTFSPDGTRLFSGSHESAKSWNLRSGLEAPNFNTLSGSQHIGNPSTTQVLDRVSGSSGVFEGSTTGLSVPRPEKRAPRPPLSITSLRWLLERSHLAYTPEDAIAPINAVSTLEANCSLMPLPEGWERKSEGWLVNHRSRLLVWLPESYGYCQLHSDADRQSRLIFWRLRYQELVGDQWPGGSGRLTKASDKSSSKQ